MDIQLTIREFLKENFMVSEEGNDVGDSDSFLETGLVDSTGMLEVIEFLEETFGIALEDEELIPENLDSIENLTNFVHRKLEGTKEEQRAV